MKPDNSSATSTTSQEHTYRIESAVTGHVFGTYEATSKRKARDVFARDGGYEDYEDLLDQIPGSEQAEVIVKQVD
jgi:hypothetical protein